MDIASLFSNDFEILQMASLRILGEGELLLRNHFLGASQERPPNEG